MPRDVPFRAPPRQVLNALSVLRIESAEISAVLDETSAYPTARTFMVVTNDGTRMKARIGRLAGQAARAATLAESLSDPRVPVPTGRVGAVTIESWVEGAPLSSVRATCDHIDSAADLLGFVHRFPGHRGERLPQARRVRAVRVRAASEVDLLLDAGIVGAETRERVAELLECSLPDSAPWGLTHGDLCPANLVIGSDGGLVSIDNELLRRGFLDYDLARTWYRWPMPHPAQRRFDARYQASAGRELSAGARRAWRVVAAVHGICIRHRLGTSVQEAIGRLRAAMADGDRQGAAPIEV